MKTMKLVIGIISIVLCGFIVFQSMAAGLGNALTDNGQVSGSAGILVAICMLIAGIIAIATKSGGRGSSFTSAGFYIFGGLIGISMAGDYEDLQIWGGLSIIFGVVFIVGAIVQSKKQKQNG